MFHRNGIPVHAVAICHAVVSRSMIKAIGEARPAARFRTGAGRDRLVLGSIVAKLAWLDLELLLET